jgi:hypothetical protein
MLPLDRIGHGILAAQDEKLMAQIGDRDRARALTDRAHSLRLASA